MHGALLNNAGLCNRHDAVVVGSGLGGSTLAYRLAQHGLRTLVIEAGDYLGSPRPEQNNSTNLYVQNYSSTPVVGGRTKFYGAAMYRMRESDFQRTMHESGESPAWPISYSDLEPYYCEAEKIYHVHGSAENDPTEPPRSLPFPYPALPHPPLVSKLVDRLRDSGSSVSHVPRAVDFGSGRKCTLCSRCDAFCCQLDAKMDADVAALRPALGSGCVNLLTRAECVRVLTDDGGNSATGVIIRHNGKQCAVHAEVVAICAGVGSSAQILRASRTGHHPHGLGNSSHCLGRYYGGHTTGILFPILSLTSKLPSMHSKTFSINTYYNGAPDWPFPTGTIQAAGQIPFWEADSVSWWKRSGAKFVGERSVYCFYMTEALPSRASGLKFDSDKIVAIVPPKDNVVTFAKLRSLAVDSFRRAGYLVLAPGRRFLWHAIGTVRFGNDPETSVLNPQCKVHDVDRLYVVDASVLPSAGAVNTGLTIAALALRTGDAIASALA